MSGGGITVTDGKGNIILSGNIWVLLRLGVFSCRNPTVLKGTRVFIDGKEVVKPESMETDT